LIHSNPRFLARGGALCASPRARTAAATVAVSTGLNYASAVSTEEFLESRNGRGSRLLQYLSPEITFALPSTPDRELVIRSHHRSGGGGIYGNTVPVYGSIFHGTAGGTQFIVVGLRQRF
jgi:hypothetical protein